MVELISGDAITTIFSNLVKYPLALVVFIVSVLVCYKGLELSVWLTILVSLALSILVVIFFP